MYFKIDVRLATDWIFNIIQIYSYTLHMSNVEASCSVVRSLFTPYSICTACFYVFILKRVNMFDIPFITTQQLQTILLNRMTNSYPFHDFHSHYLHYHFEFVWRSFCIFFFDYFYDIITMYHRSNPKYWILRIMLIFRKKIVYQ